MTYCSLCLAPVEPSKDPRHGWEHSGRSPIAAFRMAAVDHPIGVVISQRQRDDRLALMKDATA